MKCWMMSAAMMLVVSAAVAEEPSLPYYSDVVGEYSLDFSEAEFFAPPLALDVQWLPPPAAFDNKCPCPNGTCPLEFTFELEASDLLVQPASDFADDFFATLAAATEVAKCETSACACGKKCGCKSGDQTKCACGTKCQCAKGACKCGKTCQCPKGNSNGKCACGADCQCKKTASIAQVKVAKCKGCAAGKCDCGQNCSCGAEQVAALKQELMMTYQQLKFEEHLSEMRADNQRREHQMLLELSELRARAAAHEAALQQQSVAQHQQQELVTHIVRLASGSTTSQPTGDDHMRSRIEQLTIENVQLRHTIEELRKHVQDLAREPSRSR